VHKVVSPFVAHPMSRKPLRITSSGQATALRAPAAITDEILANKQALYPEKRLPTDK
ncbi:uncharacterized protein METZ01_LOCUS86292, partial [marine metagenome]